MKKYIILLLLSVCMLYSSAQTRIFTDGETIEFFPVSSVYKEQCQGYDCFYDTNKSYKDHKFNEKEKNRFAIGKNKLTPFSEIEGHKFHVEKTQKYSKDGKPINNAYIAFLTREDGAKLILRIPFEKNKNTNEITQGMVVQYIDRGTTYNGISIPFIQSDSMLVFKNLIGSTLVRNSQGKNYLGESFNYYLNRKLTKGYTLENVINNAKRLSENKSDIKRLFYNGSKVSVENIVYKDVPGYTFQQPFVYLRWHADKVYLPIMDFYGSGPSTINKNYRFVHCFSDYASTMKEHMTGLPPVTSELVKGLDVYYGRKKTFKKSDPKVHKAYYENNSYDINPGYYTIEKIDFDNTTSSSLELGIYIKDSLNNVFVVPAKAPSYSSSKDYAQTFYEAFYRKSDIHTLDSLAKEKEKAAQELEKALQDLDDADVASISKKYGAKMGKYYRELSNTNRNKFKEAASKWGAATAKDIVEGYVRIGWSKEKCRMSWGKPRDINTSIGVWGRHEQWCYYESYLYFENGKLTSIQN